MDVVIKQNFRDVLRVIKSWPPQTAKNKNELKTSYYVKNSINFKILCFKINSSEDEFSNSDDHDSNDEDDLSDKEDECAYTGMGKEFARQQRTLKRFRNNDTAFDLLNPKKQKK